MASPFYRCPYCGREDFASSKGLTQHQQQNRLCLNKMRDKFSTDSGYFTAKETLECLPVLTINRHQTNSSYPLFAHQLDQTNAIKAPLLLSNKRKHNEKHNNRSKFEDHYATAQEYLTNDDESDDGFVNVADSDTEQPHKVLSSSAQCT